jgi:cyanate permease
MQRFVSFVLGVMLASVSIAMVALVPYIIGTEYGRGWGVIAGVISLTLLFFTLRDSYREEKEGGS